MPNDPDYTFHIQDFTFHNDFDPFEFQERYFEPPLQLSDEAKNLALETLQRQRDLQKQQKQQEKIKVKGAACVRCGSNQRETAPGSRPSPDGKSQIVGQYCSDVLRCEWDAWALPCCQHCRQQFHEHSGECPEAPTDPFGNRPHVPGGVFWTDQQKEQIEREKEPSASQRSARSIEEAVEKVQHSALTIKEAVEKVKKFDEKLREADKGAEYLCGYCGRTEKPKRPNGCEACSIKMGWRKGGKIYWNPPF